MTSVTCQMSEISREFVEILSGYCRELVGTLKML